MDRGQVLHVGPSLESAGGIGGVIATYIAASSTDGWDHSAITTYAGKSLTKTAVGYLRALMAILGRRRGKPFILHPHLSQNGSFVREGSLGLIASFLGRAVVFTIHGSRFGHFAAKHPRLVRLVLSNGDVVICITGEAGRILGELGLADRVALLGNPVDVPAQEPRALGDTPTVVFAGEVGMRKGVDILLAAWRSVSLAVPKARLVLAGPISSSMFELVEGVRDMASIEFVGSLPREEVLALISDSWVAVLPSRAEALPKFLIEAMAHGRAVVATPVGAIEDFVTADVGILVPVGDAKSLAGALELLLHDVDHTSDLGKAGRLVASSRFSTEVHMEQLRSAYARAISRSSKEVNQ